MGVGGLLVVTGLQNANAGVGAAGVLVTAVGTPLAAGIAAGLAPERDVLVGLATDGCGLRVVGRW